MWLMSHIQPTLMTGSVAWARFTITVFSEANTVLPTLVVEMLARFFEN